MDAHEGIERLLYHYSTTLDTGDLEGCAALFGEAGIYGLVGGAAARGAQQVLATMRGTIRMYQGAPRTRHLVTNVIIDVGDDLISGSAQSYVQVLHQAPNGPLAPIVSGTYFDRVHCLNNVWQFAERRMLIELVGDVSSHLLTNPL